MILRITRGKVKPGSWTQFERAYRANVEKTRKAKVKGLRARWLAEDVNDKDAGITVSIWDSEADMKAYENSDFFKREIQPPLQPFFMDNYTTMYCNVKVTEEYK